MDLQAAKLTGQITTRWPKILAFAFFALACGLLIGSLAKTYKSAAIAGSAPAGPLLPLSVSASV